MTLSFLISSHNEAAELEKVVGQVRSYIENGNPDDEIVLLDDYSDNPRTLEIAETLTKLPYATVVKNSLDGDFGKHKTVGTRACKKEFIVQLDADEYLHPTLLENLKEILSSNPGVELFRVPRVNLVRGLTSMDAAKWGWHVSQLPQYPGIPVINWYGGDYQRRIYKNLERIYWHKPLHEIVVGANTVTDLPKEVELSIIHDKTIERQRAQNEFYNKNWSIAANMGRG